MTHAFEARLASYLELGWHLVHQQDDPRQARLVYRQRQRGHGPWPPVRTDVEERLLWVDETGTVRSHQVTTANPGDDMASVGIAWRPVVLRQLTALGFTPLERRIALELLRAQSNAEIAATLGLAQRTVTNYLSEMMKKTHAQPRWDCPGAVTSHCRQ